MPNSKAAKKTFKQVELSVVGLQYRVTMSTRRMLRAHLPFRVLLVREPKNNHDPCAIKVVIEKHFDIPYEGMHIGYVRRQVAAVWSPAIARGSIEIQEAWVTEIDSAEGIAEMLVKVRGAKKLLQIGP